MTREEEARLSGAVMCAVIPLLTSHGVEGFNAQRAGQKIVDTVMREVAYWIWAQGVIGNQTSNEALVRETQKI